MNFLCCFKKKRKKKILLYTTSCCCCCYFLSILSFFFYSKLLSKQFLLYSICMKQSLFVCGSRIQFIISPPDCKKFKGKRKYRIYTFLTFLLTFSHYLYNVELYRCRFYYTHTHKKQSFYHQENSFLFATVCCSRK